MRKRNREWIRDKVDRMNKDKERETNVEGRIGELKGEEDRWNYNIAIKGWSVEGEVTRNKIEKFFKEKIRSECKC